LLLFEHIEPNKMSAHSIGTHQLHLVLPLNPRAEGNRGVKRRLSPEEAAALRAAQQEVEEAEAHRERNYQAWLAEKDMETKQKEEEKKKKEKEEDEIVEKFNHLAKERDLAFKQWQAKKKQAKQEEVQRARRLQVRLDQEAAMRKKNSMKDKVVKLAKETAWVSK